MKIVAACLLAAVSTLAFGCGFVRPYVPPHAQLLAREEVYKLWEGSDGFYVVATWRMADPRNEVCVFKNREKAELYYRRQLAIRERARDRARGADTASELPRFELVPGRYKCLLACGGPPDCRKALAATMKDWND